MGDEAKDEKPDTINLKVVAQDGNEIFFKCGLPAAPSASTHTGLRGADTPPRARRRCKKTTPLQKLMNAYCQRQGAPPPPLAAAAAPLLTAHPPPPRRREHAGGALPLRRRAAA